MDDSDNELYRRVARLAYLARFEAADSWSTAHRIAAVAVRKALKTTKDAAIDRALESIATVDSNPPKRARRRLGPVAPAKPTEAQAEALHHLARYNVSTRVGTLLHLLDDVPVSEAVSRIGSFPTIERTVRDAIASVQGDLTRQEIRELLAGDELDPTLVGVSVTAVVARRRRRIRGSVAVGTAAVVVAGAGVWWFGLRTPPLGTYSDDPSLQQQKVSGRDSIKGWPARGESLGDTALLRRAADAWRVDGNPAPSGNPAVLFAGSVHNVRVVVMDAARGGGYTGGSESGLLMAVYAEGSGKKKQTRVLVNPVGELAFASGIRLMDAQAFGVDPVLLPPDATGAEAGPMTGPPGSWHPVQIDRRGVAEVPVPQLTDVQREQEVTTGDFPAGGLRFTLPHLDAGESEHNPVTLAESFKALAPLLPGVEPVYEATTPLSAADWCVAQKTAEREGDISAYSTEALADTASGPLPDGGGTGTIVDQTVMSASFGMLANSDSRLTNLALATTAGGTCTATRASDYTDPQFFLMEGIAPPPPGSFVDADAVLWTSPAKKTYLVVAATAKVSGIRVSGSVTASGAGRWLVVPVPDNYTDSTLATLAVRTVDAQGHLCGTPTTSGTSTATYCS